MAINGNSDKTISDCKAIMELIIIVPIATDPSASTAVLSFTIVELSEIINKITLLISVIRLIAKIRIHHS